MVNKIVDPYNYLLMTIDGKLLRRLFEYERLKPAVIRMDKGNINTASALKSHELGDIYLTYPCHGEFSHKTLESFNKYLYSLF